MPSELRIKEGTQWVFADHAGSFTSSSPAAANNYVKGTFTSVELDLKSTADGSAEQAAKVDLGSTRPPTLSVDATIEFAASVAAGNTVDFYWAPSTKSTAAQGNPGGVSGAVGAYSGTSGSTVDESVKQLLYIGSLVTTDDATTTAQSGHVGVFSPPTRYGTLVVVNNSGVAFHSDGLEHHISFDSIVPEGQ